MCIPLPLSCSPRASSYMLLPGVHSTVSELHYMHSPPKFRWFMIYNLAFIILWYDTGRGRRCYDTGYDAYSKCVVRMEYVLRIDDHDDDHDDHDDHGVRQSTGADPAHG